MADNLLLSTTFWSLDKGTLRFNGAQKCGSSGKRKREALERDNVSPTKIMQQNENNSQNYQVPNVQKTVQQQWAKFKAWEAQRRKD
jgi:hypothetical protein